MLLKRTRPQLSDLLVRLPFTRALDVSNGFGQNVADAMSFVSLEFVCSRVWIHKECFKAKGKTSILSGSAARLFLVWQLEQRGKHKVDWCALICSPFVRDEFRDTFIP
jgi:hypothetical protein